MAEESELNAQLDCSIESVMSMTVSNTSVMPIESCNAKGEELAASYHSSDVLESMSLKTVLQEVCKHETEELIEEEVSIGCLLCEEIFPIAINGEQSSLLAHLLSQHKIVIADVGRIADFNKYINYWKEKFSTAEDVTKYCVVINCNTGSEDKDPTEHYFLLTDFLPEDEALRSKLKNEKLCKILDEQLAERADNEFSWCCPFCGESFVGNKVKLFAHISVDHSFNVGNPDNIVHTNEFMELIKSKLDSCICLFCEKMFKDAKTLKNHMRNKSHKRIDPRNKEYDKYYLINYVDPGKNWKELQSEPEYEKEDTPEEEICAEEEWEGWVEPGGMQSLCLFCEKIDEDVCNIFSHMKADHDFDICGLKEEMSLTFYHQVKIINYIRKQVYQNRCPSCLEDLETKDSVYKHISTEKHDGLPSDRNIWDQPVYFFSTFEDDTLLWFLEEDKEDENQNILS